MYITKKKKCSYFGPFERERALDENFSMFVFFFKLIYNVRQIRYRRGEWLCVVRWSVVPILMTLTFPAYP
jgi:hypothetical protein